MFGVLQEIPIDTEGICQGISEIGCFFVVDVACLFYFAVSDPFTNLKSIVFYLQ